MKFPFQRGQDSNNRRILRAALIVASASVAVKIFATLKDITVARWFGRSDGLDAFLIAYLLPSFFAALIMSALSAALIPAIVELRHKEGEEAAQRLCSSMAVLSAAGLVLLGIILGVLAPYYLPLLGSGFSPPKLALTRHALYLLLPFVAFSGVGALASAILNANRKFMLAAIAPVATPAVTILFVVLAGRKWDAFALAAGALLGSVIETALLLHALKSSGMRIMFKWYGLSPAVRGVLGQCAPVLAGSFLMGGTSIVDQSMAAMLAGGSVAALNYANKVTGAVLTIGGMALSTAVLPYFSQMVVHGDWDGCRHTLKRYSLLVISVSIPFTVCLIAFSKPLVRLLFQRGAFQAADTVLVSRVQICYSIQIPFYVLNLLLVRFLSAVKRNDVLMYVSAINLAMDVILNLVLMRVWGVAGIALSTSLVYIVAFLCLLPWSIWLLDRSAASRIGTVKAQEAAP